MTALTTAKFLFEEVICRFGMPKSLISDHGKNYKSILFAQLCKLCQINTRNSTFYHPEGNGLVERMNKTIKQILTMYVNTSHTNWDVHLQAAISAYNTTIQDSIGCSPYEVLFGHKPSLLADVILSNPVTVDPKPLAQYLSDLKQNVQKIHQKVDNKLSVSRDRQKQYYDRFINSSMSFEIGDLVCLVNERSIVGQSKSFRQRLSGPFKIIKKFNDVNYTIVSLETKKSQDVHYNRLRPYRDRANRFQATINLDFHSHAQSIPLNDQDNDNLFDTFLFSQFIAAVIPSTSSPVELEELVEDEASDAENNENKEQVSVNNSARDLNTSDSTDSNGDDDGKTPCPVCEKRFKNVGVHLANKRDEVHRNYVRDKKNENNELAI